MKCSLLALSLLMILGCGDDDAGVPTRDAGAADAGGADTGGGATDGGGEDASSPADGGGDAGEPTDAGDVDASGTDAGADDAGSADAGDSGLVSMPCTAAGTCDPFAASACGDDKCVLGAEDETLCRPSTGSVARGGECTRAEDCVDGHICVRLGDVAVCERMCPEGSIGFCGGEDRCSGGIGHECVRFCRQRPRPCDIYVQDCPDAGDGCNFATDPETGERYTGCRPAGPQGLGDPCGGMDPFCAAGLVCIRVDGAASCHEVCDAEDPDVTCTNPDQTCSGRSSSYMVTYCR